MSSLSQFVGEVFQQGNLKTISGVSLLGTGDITPTTIPSADNTLNSIFYPVFASAQTAVSGSSTHSTYTYNPGTATLSATNFSGLASSAKYADLAEKYEADCPYEPGTVLVFGGSKEVTVTTKFADAAVAGAVSTAPAYLMNSESTGIEVALRGRVPIKVLGTVRKGDLLVTSTTPGYAMSVGSQVKYGAAVIAKSLEDSDIAGGKVITGVIL